MFFLGPGSNSSYETRLGLFDHLSQSLPPGVNPRTDRQIEEYEDGDALVVLGELLLPEVYGGDVPDDATMAARFDTHVPAILEILAGRMRPEHLAEVMLLLGHTAVPIDSQAAGGGHPPLC